MRVKIESEFLKVGRRILTRKMPSQKNFCLSPQPRLLKTRHPSGGPPPPTNSGQGWVLTNMTSRDIGLPTYQTSEYPKFADDFHVDKGGEEQKIKKWTSFLGDPKAYFSGQNERRKRNSGIMKHNERAARTRSPMPMKQRHAECMYARTEMMIWFRPTNSDIPRDSTDHE